LFKYGIGLEDVRAALAAANANSPKGSIEDPSGWQVYANDQRHRGRGLQGPGRRLSQ
jgi:multidrug efflux pump